jgi:hypothetical protein
MKKLSFKWKLFLAACYLQLPVYGFLLVVVFNSYSNTSNSAEDTLYFIITVLAFILVWLNNILCIITVHRYFPDTLLPSKRKKLIHISGIINVVVFTGLLVLLIAGFLYYASETYIIPAERESAMFAHISLCFVWASGVFPLILQFRMAGYLASNNSEKMDALINSIGR